MERGGGGERLWSAACTFREASGRLRGGRGMEWCCERVWGGEGNREYVLVVVKMEGEDKMHGKWRLWMKVRIEI